MSAKRRTFVIIAAMVAALLPASLAATHASAVGTASITGTVREAGTGVPVGGVSVELFKEITRTLGPPFGNGKPFKTPGFVKSVQTGADGTYALTNLDASDAAGYWVCFNTFGVPYEPQCYLDELGYNPFPNPLGLIDVPAHATRVQVAAGQHVARIDASLFDFAVLNPATAGTIAGKVTQTVLG
jgi:hypothetical protein